MLRYDGTTAALLGAFVAKGSGGLSCRRICCIWVASWASFMGQREYWRLSQSGRLVHLHAIEGAVNERWRERLRQPARAAAPARTAASAPGFISFLNLHYGITEAFEIAARV